MNTQLTRAQSEALKALSEAEGAYNTASVHADYYLQMNKLRLINEERAVELAEQLKAAYEYMMAAHENYLQIMRLEENNAD